MKEIMHKSCQKSLFRMEEAFYLLSELQWGKLFFANY